MPVGTRERIMDVALQLFAEQGVAATPITAIEAGAGLSAGSGSFYRHFKDKAELLSALVEREMARVTQDQTGQVIPQGPPADALATRLRSDLDFLGELKPMIAILMWEQGRALELAERLQRTMIERGAADLLHVPSPAVREDPAAATTVMMSAVIGYFLVVEYFGAPPADVGAERFTAMLARLLIDPAEDGGTVVRQ